jgi:protein ImuB
MFAAVHAPGLDRSRTAELAEVAEDFAPGFEKTSSDTIVFPVTGLSRWYPDLASIAQAVAERAGRLSVATNVAVAAVVDVALAAARGRTGITVIPRGCEEATLGPMSLAVAAASLFSGSDSDNTSRIAAMIVTLDSWGVRTCCQLASLPPLGVLERLGEPGMQLQQLARGIAGRPFHPEPIAAEYHERTELEYPVALMEPLLFLIADQLNRLCARLDSNSLATGHIELALRLEPGAEYVRVYRLPVPTRGSAALLKLIHLDLEANPPCEPVTAVAVRMIPVKPRTVQNGLFIPVAPEPDKLELTLKRIARVVGDDRVGSPRLIDTHRPDAFTLARLGEPGGAPVSLVDYGSPASSSQMIRRFRPTLAARVETNNDSRPIRISAPRGIRGSISAWAGPWNTAGDWWTPTPWSREEWDISVACGGSLYRIFRDSSGWYVDGEYD